MIAAPNFEKRLHDNMRFWSMGMTDQQIETRFSIVVRLVNDCLALSGQRAPRCAALSPQ
jgi:hypothetical protein